MKKGAARWPAWYGAGSYERVAAGADIHHENWRERLLRIGAVFTALSCAIGAAAAEEPAAAPHQKRVAAIVTEYRHNSHADVIVSRLLQTDTLDGKGRESPLVLVSLYTDQRPANDISRLLAASHRFRTSDTIEDALTLGTGKLAVDGVLLVAEHGNYPKSATGNTQYPKRRFWEETVRVFRSSGRVVPVFIDKHLADNWDDAKRIYDTARELKVPLMAGSSLPGLMAQAGGGRGARAKLAEIVSITYGSSDAYAFHAMEFTQALAEHRHGGETGVKAGARVEKGTRSGKLPRRKCSIPRYSMPPGSEFPILRTGGKPLREVVPEPKLFTLEYNDGLTVHLLELNGAAVLSPERGAMPTTAGSNRANSGRKKGAPPAHFTLLLNGIERMMLSGRPSWNVERTLLTSGALDALLASLVGESQQIETPYLDVTYEPMWRWQEPPPPPPMRPGPSSSVGRGPTPCALRGIIIAATRPVSL